MQQDVKYTEWKDKYVLQRTLLGQREDCKLTLNLGNTQIRAACIPRKQETYLRQLLKKKPIISKYPGQGCKVTLIAKAGSEVNSVKAVLIYIQDWSGNWRLESTALIISYADGEVQQLQAS